MAIRVYICDIDGTLADLKHRLHFIEADKKDWDGFFDACDGDEPIQNVINTVRDLAYAGNEFMYVTGRPERVRMKTRQWLLKHGLPLGSIYMRKNGDHRPDTIAKRELMDELHRLGCEVVAVFEDRPSVVRV